jgi:deoxycytidylate deaminase
MYEATVALHKCITIKCKKEKEQSEQSNKSKYIVEKEKLMLEFSKRMEGENERYKKYRKMKKMKDRVRGDIEFGEYYMKYMKANADLDIKIIEERYHNELLNCRLKGCYNESLLLLNLTIENIVSSTDKNTELYKLASKYKTIFETNKLTVNDINAFEIDKKKVELASNLAKLQTDMIKLKKKL